MVIAFYLSHMDFRGVANSTFNYALNNEKILKNKSLIFFNKNNLFNKKEVIKKFQKQFKTFGVNNLKDIDDCKLKNKINFIYIQKGGEKDSLISNKIKTLVHVMYPQQINQKHGYRYAFISEWLSKKFSNGKISYVPYIVQINKTKKNLRKELKINKNITVLGCHGGESSFDLKFVHDSIVNVVNKRKDIYFLFLNINKFCKHPRVKFLNGTSDEILKKKFLNTCDGMIYGRSLGESFGLSCGEFAIQNKKIISYKYNRHRSHEFNTSRKIFLEYGSYKELYNILLNFKLHKKRKNKVDCKYKEYDEKKVMKIFKKTFLTNQDKSIALFDYFQNILSFFKMSYYYFKHKLYTHYYNLIETYLIKS